MSVRAGLLRLADRVADTIGVMDRPLAAEDLIGAAQSRARIDAFNDAEFIEPLRVLLRAYDEEASLSLFGRMAARWDVIRLLTNVLRLQQEERRAPEIMEQPIRSPVFITGMPRSGTSFLHGLMAVDPANLAPKCWQTIYPYPNERDGDDQRPDRVERQLRLFYGLAPGLSSVHPLSADAPQECTEVTAHLFRSLRFDTTHYVPSYRTWLDRAGHLEAYRFHARFLRHLQRQTGPGRWVLKSPDHVFAMDALHQVYPDACIVYVHRDPVRVLSSVAQLTEILRRPFARQVDRRQIGRQVSAHWEQGARRMIEACTNGFPSDRIFHVHHRELVARPMETVDAIYRQFGFSFGPEAQSRMNRLLTERPNGGYGRNQYQPEDFGLEPEAERSRFSFYMEHFGVRQEALPPPAPA